MIYAKVKPQLASNEFIAIGMMLLFHIIKLQWMNGERHTCSLVPNFTPFLTFRARKGG